MKYKIDGTEVFTIRLKKKFDWESVLGWSALGFALFMAVLTNIYHV